MISFKGSHYPKEVLLLALRLYLSYPLSYSMVEEMLRDRGINVDRSTIQRWVVKFSSQLATNFLKRKRPVGDSWHMDETYIKVKGQWVYQYRAIDKAGQTLIACCPGIVMKIQPGASLRKPLSIIQFHAL